MSLTFTQHAARTDDGRDRFLSSAGWGVAVALFVMFTGMMHDFRSIGLSQEQVHADMLDSRADFNADVSKALPERKVAFVLSALIACYCWLSSRRRVDWDSWLPLALIALGLGWAGMSILWSADRALTARSLVRIAVYAFLCLSLARRFTPLQLIRMLVVVSALSIGLTVVVELAIGSPEFVDEVYRLNGSMHPNSLSRFAVLLAIPAFAFAWSNPSQRIGWSVAFLAAAVVVYLTHSRTSLASLAAGLVVLAAVRLGLKRIALPASAAVSLLGLTIMLIGLGGRAATISAGDTIAMGRSESVATLTGRIPLWETLLRLASRQQIFGYGYGGFWNTNNMSAIHREVGWQAGHSHNCYIEILVNLGLVGLLLFVVLGAVCFLRTIRMASTTGLATYAVLASLIATAGVNGLAEVGFVLPREHAIVLGLFAFMAAQAPAAEDVAAEAGVSRGNYPVALAGRACPA